jgi:hypothetical protein
MLKRAGPRLQLLSIIFLLGSKGCHKYCSSIDLTAVKCAQAMGRFTSGGKCAIKNVCPPTPRSNGMVPAKYIFSIFSSGPVYKQQVECLRKRPCKEADAGSLFIVVACRERESNQFCDYWRRRSRNNYGLYFELCLCFGS